MLATDSHKQILIVDRDVAAVEPLRQRLCDAGFAHRTRVPHTVRLILLSALSTEPAVVAAFNLGADDYITKPFSPREVVARVSAVLRAHTRENHRSVISCYELVLDASANRVTVRGRSLNLRGAEYRLLEFLMSNPGRTFNRTQRLAQICDRYIQTVRGVGYRFE
jgi:DNA-binding response OmpR family regulator